MTLAYEDDRSSLADMLGLLDDSIRERHEWKLDAACRGMANMLFYPERGQDANEARLICQTCPVRVTCLTVALSEKDRHGVHGSTTEKERRILLRRVAAGESIEAVADSWLPRINYGWHPTSSASERYAKAWALRAGRQRVAAA